MQSRLIDDDRLLAGNTDQRGCIWGNHSRHRDTTRQKSQRGHGDHRRPDNLERQHLRERQRQQPEPEIRG
ncbi:MAG: hypothetical protein ACO3DQ_07605 [Cephaloticoccus sp.]